MKVGNILKGLLPLVMVGSAFANTLNPYWHQLPEEQTSSDKAVYSDSLDSIDNVLGAIVDGNREALDSVENNTDKAARRKSKWYLGGMETNLGLGLSGSIGVIGFGGTKTVKLKWARLNLDKSVTTEEAVDHNITVSEATTKDQLDREFNVIADTLVKSGKVKDEAELKKNLQAVGRDFYEHAKGMKLNTRSVWYPSKLRLDISVGASGKINPVFVKLGGDVRIRLEWVRLMTKSSSDKGLMDKLNSKISKSMNKLMKDLSEDITSSVEGKRDFYDFSLSKVKVGLGLSIEGKVVVAKLKGELHPQVFFSRQVVSTSDKALVSFPLNGDETMGMKADNAENVLKYAKTAGVSFDKGIKESIFKMKRRRVRKGLKKAYKFAKKFAKKVSKRKKKKNSKWVIKEIESAYKFSISGSAGVVKLKAEPNFALFFKNNNAK